MRRRTFLTTLVSAFPLAGCVSPQKTSRSSRAEIAPLIADLEGELPKLMERFSVPGLSVAVVNDARIVWRRGFGFKNAITKEPVDDNTIFQAGSMSKPVFAYSVLKLCEKGILGLDTPFARLAPEPFLTGDSRLDQITPRHILSHTAGFPNWRSGRDPLKINFTPGSQYRYSGEGYYFLQSVITHLLGRVNKVDCAVFEDGYRVCGSDIDQFLTANVLKPFGMTSSGYFVTGANENHIALPHDNDGKLLSLPKSTSPAVTRYASAGALLTTPTDYAKFIIEILDPKKPDNFRLKKQTIAEMLKPHVKVVNGQFTSSWALGWQIQDNGLFNHGGDNTGFHCHSIGSRESKSAFIVMTNGDRGAALILDIFTSKILERIFPVKAES